jgi:bis(5'-nucleosyl)-tetraphosphatase (symmetrical)
MHLIGCALGGREPHGRDTFEDVLSAPDCDDLIDWLRHRPFLHRQGDLVLVHAGLHPTWSVERAQELAGEAEAQLRGPSAGAFAGRLRQIGKLEKVRWRDGLAPERRAEMAAVILVSIRSCRSDGELCDYDGPPDEAPAACRPWFERWRPQPPGARILFGHWSALGLSIGAHHVGLDTGCVWGRTLTAMRLEDMTVFSQHCVEWVA